MKTELLRKIRKDYYCKIKDVLEYDFHDVHLRHNTYAFMNKKSGKITYSIGSILTKVLGVIPSIIYDIKISKHREQRGVKKKIYKFLNDK